ncbi:MAG TPA: 5-formyltetrahydrofolate cyclo-ligase [Anaerovoracaceae bacterium]|nr:5-formyltetrahydrofolate cyclo-ligase [Anaerovoracaceae bacterium]
MSDKILIRKQILEKRAALTPDILNKACSTAADKLTAMEEYIRARTVMVYMDFRNEVPTGTIIEQIRRSGKKLVLPLVDKDFSIIPYEIPNEGSLSDYLATSGFGIAEPDPDRCRQAERGSIDLVIIPGSVFDQYENRIGYGKGCYDRFLPTLPPNVFKLGLAYDFQVLPCIPADPTDIKMDKILTVASADKTPLHG